MNDEVEAMFVTIEKAIGGRKEPSEVDMQVIAMGAVAFMREIRDAMYAIRCIEERTRPNV